MPGKKGRGRKIGKGKSHLKVMGAHLGAKAHTKKGGRKRGGKKRA